MGFSNMVSIHPRYGYKYLKPMPTESELADFYGRDYYDFSQDTDRAPDLQRLTSSSAQAEIDWLTKTLWLDIYNIIDTYLGPRRRMTLDFGCGTGHFAQFLSEHNCRVAGVEPAEQARKIANTCIPVFSNLSNLKSNNPKIQFDIVTLLNVLEHISAPDALLAEIKAMMTPGGLVIIRVPNDFSILQATARRVLSIDPWWISYPDHINYFGFESLSHLLEDSGFTIVSQMSDFPMEFFLLFGDDYISNPLLGEECHIKRRNFELALNDEIRRELYRDFAKRGMGRNCLVIAQLME